MKFTDLDGSMEEFSNMLDETWMKSEVASEVEPEDEELDLVPNAPGCPTFTFKALCTSEHCSPNSIGAEKNVARSKDTCPDCSHYLFWSRELA